MITLPIHSAVIVFAAEGQSIWTEEWSWEPGVVVPMLVFGVLYGVGAIRRGNFLRLRWWHASLAGGWMSLLLALTSPIHELSEQLFSAHMLQHEIIILASAPLIASAHPGATFLWAFAPGRRRGIGRWMHRLEDSLGMRFVSAPLNAWILEAAALWLWHVPVLYQATLQSDWIHAAQHLCFLLTAVLFWSALYGMGRSATNFGAAAVYVFGTAVHCTALGALRTFSRVLWYPMYANTTVRWGLAPLTDQQLGGVIVWVPSGAVFIAIALALMARWIAESDRRLKFGRLAAVLDKESRV